ncbi:MAG TPA: methyltransferase domain-containing protein [Candidatus Hydrogenedentes bacterium]|nr:methyltransferase domain-containing protein [Candidatus Hydrogenedentota bacterium]
MDTIEETHESVQIYYGQVLHRSGDLKTNACCSTETMPEHLRKLVQEIEPEVLERFYGCGAPIPTALEGCTVLDLGSGTGRDVFLASRLVGPTGHVIGVDMTDEQLNVARECLPKQMARYGYDDPNVTFHKGYIEDLAALGIQNDSVDVVISDCVINLSSHKKQVFKEVFRVLKLGGELYFSDVVSERRLPEHLMNDPVLLGECLAGAMSHEDFRLLMEQLGCSDVRKTSTSPITISNADIEANTGMAKFFSTTYRVFKFENLEYRCEDYGQVAYYRGTLPDYPHDFQLDDHHAFEKDKPILVCGNTATMLQDTRFRHHFRIEGDRKTHFGLFNCDDSSALDGESVPCC